MKTYEIDLKVIRVRCPACGDVRNRSSLLAYECQCGARVRPPRESQ